MQARSNEALGPDPDRLNGSRKVDMTTLFRRLCKKNALEDSGLQLSTSGAGQKIGAHTYKL